MKLGITLVLALFGAGVWAAPNPLICADQDRNIASKRLEGTWLLDKDLVARLGIKWLSNESIDEYEVKITKDESVLPLFKGLLNRTGECAYFAGHIRMSVWGVAPSGATVSNTFRSPVVLTVRHGNSNILYDDKGYDYNDEPIVQIHRAFVQLVNSGPASPENDLLFIGGGETRERKSPFKRK